METAMGRKRKERTHTLEAGEENCTQRKKTMKTTPGRKRKERTHTLEEEENCKQRKLDKAKIDVSFSKRRKGLFGKAARLCKDFDDTRLAVLVVSKASRAYAFGHSSVDEVLNDHCHIQPTTTKAAEGLNLMRKLQEKKKVMCVKHEIENEMMACQTVEGLALLREKYLKLDEEIKERLRHCSSEQTSFEGGVMDQRYNIDIMNVGGDGRSLGSGYESCYTDLFSSGGLRLEGDTGGHQGWLKDAPTGIIGNPLLDSSESNYAVHDGGLTMNNGTFNGNGCSLGLFYGIGNTSLSDPTIANNDSNFWLEIGLGLGHEINGNSSQDLTTDITLYSNVAGGGGSRVNGDTDAQGCPSGLCHDVGNTSSVRDPTTGISDNFWPELGLGLGHEVSGKSSTDSTTGITLCSNTSNYGVDHVVGGGSRVNGDTDAQLCQDVGYTSFNNPTTGINNNFLLGLQLGLGHEATGYSSQDLTTGISDNSLCSTTSNYGVDHGVGGELRLNGDTDAQGCPIGLCHDVGNTSLREPTTGISDNSLLELGSRLGHEAIGNSSQDLTSGVSGNSLCSTTSNYEVGHRVGGGLRLIGDVDIQGCPFGLQLEGNGNSSGDSTTGFDSGDFDLEAWLSPSNNDGLGRTESSSELVQSNTNKGYYSYLMEGDINTNTCSYMDSCNFSL